MKMSTICYEVVAISCTIRFIYDTRIESDTQCNIEHYVSLQGYIFNDANAFYCRYSMSTDVIGRIVIRCLTLRNVLWF